MDIETLYRKINAVKWYHRFELLPGVFTPGRYRLTENKPLAISTSPRILPEKKFPKSGRWMAGSHLRPRLEAL